MAEFLIREINCHIKLEMLKQILIREPGWNTKAAFNLIDIQRRGQISHADIYGFLKSMNYDASNEELIAIVRRTDCNGYGKIEFNEFA